MSMSIRSTAFRRAAAVMSFVLAGVAAACGTAGESETESFRTALAGTSNAAYSESMCRDACEAYGAWGDRSGAGCTCVCATRCSVCGNMGCNMELGY